MRRTSNLVSAVAAVSLCPAVASAVILLDTPTRNTTAPTGPLAGSGWQWQGFFNAFLGTAISPKHFITAQHLFTGEFGLSQPFFYDGGVYQPESFFDIPGTDLRLYRIAQTFNTWAPLYDRAVDGSEVGKPLVVFGRGTQRGEPVYVTVPATPPDGSTSVSVRAELRGWEWGTFDSVRSWGQNTVTDLIDFGVGDTLYFEFDNPGGPNEATLSVGDSGGGVFIQSSTGQWKLAGINFSVDNPFRRTETGPAFSAAIFDAGGLYLYDSPPQFIPDTHARVPTGSYSSSIASSLSTINNQLAMPASASAIPEPTAMATMATGGALMLRRRGRHAS